MPKGIVKNPVRCRRCFEPRAGKTGLCMQCTLEEKNTLYAWTPELDEELRDIYATSASRRQLALRMSALVERTGFPRTAFQGRTNKLNLRFCFRKSYTPAEVDYIEQNVGPKSIREVAKDLGRSWHAVAVKSRELGISAVARRDGYTATQFAELLGVTDYLVEQWERWKWISRSDNGRFSNRTMRIFLREHIDVVNMRRADHVWLADELMDMLAGLEPEPSEKTVRFKPRLPRSSYHSSALAVNQ